MSTLPKQKAIHFYNTMNRNLPALTINKRKAARKCAISAVDEILKEWQKLYLNEWISDATYRYQETYYLRVKDEINKL